MKAKLRAGKQGAKGAVKKYADGGLLAAPTTQTTMGSMDPAGAASTFNSFTASSPTAPTAPTTTALQSLASQAAAAPATPRPTLNPGGQALPSQANDRAREAMAAIAARRAAPTAPVAAPSMPSRTMPSLPSQASSMAANRLKAMTPGAQVMPGGRAFKKGGMVGCDWSPKSSKTMRGAARKG